MSRFERTNDFFTDVEIKKLVEGETNERIIAYAVRSNKLTFEDRYQISHQSDRGLANLAYENGKAFFDVPELEEELFVKANSLADSGNFKDADYAYQILGSRSNREDVQQAVLDNSNDTEFLYMSPYSQLAINPNIKEKVLVDLVEKMSKNNVRDFKELAETVDQTLRNAKRKGSGAYWQSRQDYRKVTLDAHPVFTPDEVEEMNVLKAEEYQEGFNQRKALRLGALQAAMDCYAPNYKVLHARYKAFEKRNAPEVDSFGDTRKTLERRLVNAQNYTQTLNFLNVLKKAFKIS